jgi:iron complex outermembrane receptor protein
MVFQEKVGARSVRLAVSALALIAAGQVAAQEAPMQRVEITGSAIKRIAVEGALPVQRLSQEQIAKTGATTVADLIQALPSMQGFTVDAVAAGTTPVAASPRPGRRIHPGAAEWPPRGATGLRLRG